MPQESLKHCDAVVIGEVELVIDRLLEDLEAGVVRGTYKSDTLHSMVGLPMPRYDLIQKNRYVNRTFVQTSRGCHQGCTFCAEPLMNGLKFRYRPVDEVIDEMENCGSRIVSINDADFFGTPERPKEVMRALKGRGIQWQAGVTSKLALRPLPGHSFVLKALISQSSSPYLASTVRRRRGAFSAAFSASRDVNRRSYSSLYSSNNRIYYLYEHSSYRPSNHSPVLTKFFICAILTYGGQASILLGAVSKDHLQHNLRGFLATLRLPSARTLACYSAFVRQLA
jgi:hypothetical protein